MQFFFSMFVHQVIALIRALKDFMRVDSSCSKSKFYGKDLIDEFEIFGMSSWHDLNDFMHDQIIEKIEGGWKITDLSKFDIVHSVVSRLWKSFKSTGMCSMRHVESVVNMTPEVDRFIVYFLEQ